MDKLCESGLDAIILETLGKNRGELDPYTLLITLIYEDLCPSITLDEFIGSITRLSGQDSILIIRCRDAGNCGSGDTYIQRGAIADLIRGLISHHAEMGTFESKQPSRQDILIVSTAINT